MKEKIKAIDFSETPKIKLRVISFSDNELLAESKKRYPFELYKKLKVCIETTKRSFCFYIDSGYTWNGADIPRVFWRLIGSKTDNEFLVASMLHDYLLDNKFHILEDVLGNKLKKEEYRRLTSLIFRFILKKHGTNKIKANIMSFFIDIFQMLNKKRWKYNGNIY